jgi:flagellar motor switch protein FliN/FliY
MIGLVDTKDHKMADDEQASAEKIEMAPVEENLKPTTEAEALLDVEVEITVVLGTSSMPIAQVLKLGRGAVIELDRSVDEDIEIHANNRAVAKGEIVVIDDRLGITMTEIIKTSV